MNCGYDPDPNFEYDTPPIAPQIWHAYHIAGEQLATGIIAALIHRDAPAKDRMSRWRSMRRCRKTLSRI